jgi:hypothetical protein
MLAKPDDVNGRVVYPPWQTLDFASLTHVNVTITLTPWQFDPS